MKTAIIVYVNKRRLRPSEYKIDGSTVKLLKKPRKTSVVTIQKVGDL